MSVGYNLFNDYTVQCLYVLWTCAMTHSLSLWLCLLQFLYAGQEPIQVASQINPTIHGSEAVSTPPVLEQTDVRIDVAEPIVRDTEINNQLDVLKSIVYGGLIESLTSLGVVSSAAASGASTCKFQNQNPLSIS